MLLFRRGLPLIALCWTMFSMAAVSAQDERPLFRQDPFDQIHLKDETVLKVLPLEKRTLPASPRPNDTLTVRLPDRPGEEYSIRWRDIADVKLFEQLVLDKANELAAAEQFDEAFEYFNFLHKYYPDFPGVNQAIAHYHFAEATHVYGRGETARALALLEEVAARDAKHVGLGNALAEVADRVIDERIRAGQITAARTIFDRVARPFPNEERLVQRRQWFDDRAKELAQQATVHLQEGRLRQAQIAARKALEHAPAMQAVRDLSAQVHQQYPYVVVGVMHPYVDDLRSRFTDPAARRVRRLLHRPLAELIDYGPEGGTYGYPLGALEKAGLGLRLSLQLRTGMLWSGTDVDLTGYDVARHLLALGSASSGIDDPRWAAILTGVSVPDPYSVQIELSQAHVLPEALLTDPILAWNHPRLLSTASTGPYQLADGEDRDTHFTRLNDYFAVTDTQPHEVVERYYRKNREALADLRSGAIQVVDRVNPWDLATLRDDPALKVAPYAVPTVHCLVANFDKPLPARRTFRRALLYAVDRQRILVQQLLRGEERSGCQVISGLFPVGYAYDQRIEPRPYEPRLAAALARVAVAEIKPPAAPEEATEEAAAEEVQQEPDTPPSPAAAEAKPEPVASIRLLHPPDEVATVACRAIAQYLQAIGLEVTLVTTSDADAADWDFQFMELAVLEPVVDVPALLGPTGVLNTRSAYVELAIRQLAAVDDLRAARSRLQQLHRLIHEDVSVIPLWQMTDRFAYRATLQGLAERPVTLYQHIEQWKAPLELPSSQP